MAAILLLILFQNVTFTPYQYICWGFIKEILFSAPPFRLYSGTTDMPTDLWQIPVRVRGVWPGWDTAKVVIFGLSGF